MPKQKNNEEKLQDKKTPIENQNSRVNDSLNYKIISKDKKDSKLSLEIEVAFSELENKREKAIVLLGKEVEIKGFRKGSVPKNLVAQEVGEAKIIEEMSYQTIISILPKLVAEEKINALTQPNISITKLAPNNPLIFKAVFILMPEIDVADYKKIAKSVKPINEIKVDDSEINEYIDYIRSSKAEAESLRRKTSSNPEERKEANKKVAIENSKGDEVDEKAKNREDGGTIKKPESELPELNDDFVKTLGDFKNVADFKKQLRENMEKDKKQKAEQKRRLEIIEEIISESKIDVPDLMIEEELERMLQQFKGDLSNAKIDFEEYLIQIKKTKEDLLKEWRPDAIKRTKMNLILPKIAVEEKIEANPEKVDAEVKLLKQHYPEIEDDHARSYVSHILRNDEVFKFLEELK